MMKIDDRLFETDRHQQSDRDGRDVDKKLSPRMNVLVRWMYFYHRVKGLTRTRSATAGGSERCWTLNSHPKTFNCVCYNCQWLAASLYWSSRSYSWPSGTVLEMRQSQAVNNSAA